MQEYQLRVVKEKEEIDARTKRLEGFMGNSRFLGIPTDERVRMGQQCYAMREYSKALGERIKAFTE